MTKKYIITDFACTSHVHHFVFYDENSGGRIQSAHTEQQNSAVAAMTHLNASDWLQKNKYDGANKL